MIKRLPQAQTSVELNPDHTEAERIARLHFHLKTGDYFPTLATMLGFLEETIGNYAAAPAALPPLECDLVRSIRKDLMYLHTYYNIEPRTEVRA